jgi:hypothetical protein
MTFESLCWLGLGYVLVGIVCVTCYVCYRGERKDSFRRTSFLLWDIGLLLLAFAVWPIILLFKEWLWRVDVRTKRRIEREALRSGVQEDALNNRGQFMVRLSCVGIPIILFLGYVGISLFASNVLPESWRFDSQPFWLQMSFGVMLGLPLLVLELSGSNQKK